LADRLSVGGSDLETNTITAGQVKIGTSENIVDIIGGGYLNIPRRVTFDGVDALGNETNVQGNMLAQMLFMRGNRPDEQ
jgi:cytoskeletal protein CcmA (bactofilin family)